MVAVMVPVVGTPSQSGDATGRTEMPTARFGLTL
jgi:hypothetical protein